MKAESAASLAASEIGPKVGRSLCVGIPGTRLDEATRQALLRMQVGSVVLFRRNFSDLDQLRDLCAELHALPSRPLVGIDHEGGRVMRLSAPFTHFPPAAAIGRSGDPRLAYRVGRAMGAELRSVGIDISFAPVLDVHSNPSNPVIGDRSFGADPAMVAEMGLALMRGLLAGGVLPCGKHFPGHGDTAKDSHHELPVVERTWAQIDSLELLPFRAAVEADIPMLMTAHVVYPCLDAEWPATMSRAIVSGLLRDRMGFAGVVASDDLDMRAIADHHSIGAAVTRIVLAGVDLLLLCNDFDKAQVAFAALAEATRAGAIGVDRWAEATRRLDRLRERLPATYEACQVPSPEHQALAASLA